MDLNLRNNLLSSVATDLYRWLSVVRSTEEWARWSLGGVRLTVNDHSLWESRSVYRQQRAAVRRTIHPPRPTLPHSRPHHRPPQPHSQVQSTPFTSDVSPCRGRM